jgi:putative transcriptional regulator
MKTRIEHLRKAVGLTQEALADKVGVTRQTIISLERGRYNPSLGLAYAIAKALKQSRIEDVFELP